tara:strand:+ start:4154 stop:4351 length:198 start_codon:yes stop_codon:yes gene_type:complete
MQNHNKQRRIGISEKDLPLHCPMPPMKIWNSHPRVFLPLNDNGEALCPYCGTLYFLEDNKLTDHS